jgi:hypothetical protein
VQLIRSRTDAAQVQLEVEADIEQTSDLLPSFEVAAHPEQSIGDATQHDFSG